MALGDFVGHSAAVMSNYTIFYLRQNPHLYLNCSVYSLTLGSIKYQDYDSGEWLANMTRFLPAYYVTNCSIPGLFAEIARQNVSLDDIQLWYQEVMQDPYNYSDAGSSFVALLFMLVGLCVSCWMLSLLFLLLPKHKQKPFLTQAAVLFYLVFLTVILSRVAATAKAEYYSNSLDMVRMLSDVHSRRFNAVFLMLNALTQLAFAQLLLEMTKRRWKLANGALVGVLIVACLLSGAFFVHLMKNPLVFPTVVTSTRTLFVSVRVLFMVWFAVCLARYTLVGTATPPKQVSYSRKLLPLAILTWMFIFAYIINAILLVTLWKDRWLVNAWISFLPNLLSMYVLTSSWEWFFSIRHLELRLEIVDMLGRRITLEDVMDFNNDDKVKRTAFRGRFATLRGLLRENGRDSHIHHLETVPSTTPTTPTSSIVAPAIVDCVGDETYTLAYVPSARHDETCKYEVQYMDMDSWVDSSHLLEPQPVPLSEDNELVHSSPDAQDPGNDDAIGASSYFPEATEGPSNQLHGERGSLGENSEDLPPFRPHPGFSKDDYWDEK